MGRDGWERCLCVYLCDAVVREYNRSFLVTEGFSSFGTFVN